MWAKDHTQAIRLGSRHLYSLSHLADPLTDLLNTLTDDKGSVGAQRDGSVPKSTFIPLPEDPNSTRSTYITWSTIAYNFSYRRYNTLLAFMGTYMHTHIPTSGHTYVSKNKLLE